MVIPRSLLSLLPVTLALALASGAAAAPKIDKETCDQLKGEQAKFMESGIVADLQKGPEWGKANLPPDRLREIEHFILLDEQLKFGCRQVTLTGDILRAGEAANKIEANPNPAADPAAAAGDSQGSEGAATTAPAQAKPQKPAAKPAKPKAEKSAEAPSKPKAADAYQPQRSGPPVNP